MLVVVVLVGNELDRPLRLTRTRLPPPVAKGEVISVTTATRSQFSVVFDQVPLHFPRR